MIALVDCNNFYASCERLFNPKLRTRPVVVLSNNDGCVIARSNEAKELGIKMGAPAFMIERELKQHNVAVFSSNYTLYGDLSDRVHETLSRFTDRLEIYSIDEAFLDLTTFRHYNLTDYCTTIRQTIGRNIGIPVSIGAAPSKTLAKMANRFAKKKKTGVFVLDTPEKAEEVLRFTEVADIWGVGSQYAKLLIRNGFDTAYDLSRAPEEFIRKKMTVQGQRLWNELKGIPCIDFELVPPAKKMICVARGFGKLLTGKEDIQAALSTYTAMVGQKLRTEKLVANMIHIFVQTNGHRTQDQQYFRSINMQLPVASSSSTELIHYAMNALDRIFKEGYNYNKTGCIAMELVPEDQAQYGMFDNVNRKRDNILMKALDKVNLRFGRDTIRFARMGYDRKFKLRQARLSPCYTTRLEHVPIINI